MMLFMRRAGLAGIFAVLVAGCSGVGGLFGGGKEVTKPGPAVKYAATIRLLPYVDERKMGNPHKIGIGGENIYGLHTPDGTDILIDREVAAVVTEGIKKRLEETGYQVVESGNAHFEMSGAVKELTYNITSRDNVSIVLATTVKEVGTDKVMWAGVVEEKKDRFAGVSGNDMSDVLAFLKKELGIVTQKTNDAVSTVLMLQRPELFNLIPGTRPIAGVTVLNSPNYASSVPPAVPAASPAQGVLTINTDPPRARVYVDNVNYGLSPLRLEMEPGIRNVTVKLDGYKMASEKVSVRKGETTEVELKLKR